MERDAEGKLLRFRTPVGERFWREYGVPLGFVLTALLCLALLVGGFSTDSLVVAALFVGLSAGAVLAGLAVYNVVVVALLLSRR
ncbi:MULTISPECIES: hypothetical protein [Halorussus]|uniref:hypothetical protein n=1 Tax=Halorussus TaxID=1070314 RepID=UPI0020A1E376|nr:hypothetical protein [Halorussus vallis]USZ76858.1 hypothetical protein NGM07_05895 [Halorussus vallis]